MKRLIALVLVGAGLAFIQPGTAQAQSIVNGVITAYVNIQVNSPIPTGASVYCEFTVSVEEVGTSVNSHTETVTAVATHSSGVIYSCTLPIPYYWPLSTPGSDPVTMSYSIGILPANATILQQGSRFGSHSLPPLAAVPADGTHTNINAPTARL